MNKKTIFLFAGEASGDLHGEKLYQALRKRDPNAKIYGVGGPKMRGAGFESILPMEKFQVMGFFDVFLALPKLLKHFLSLRNRILREKPDVVIFIDYPGFNLRLAKSLRKRGFQGKLCQYICPSVWAWGKGRIGQMEKTLDHLFVIFPFEKKLFNSEKLSVHYVGHPLVHTIAADSPPPLEIDQEKEVVALFPGSREKELLRNFPIQVRVAKRLHQKIPHLFFVVSLADPSFSPKLEEILRKEEFNAKESIFFINSSQNLALMQRSSLALAKSGTNNLELALHGVPTVVTYGITPIDLFIAKNILRINLPHYCIVNIISEKEVYPELIGPNFTEESLFKEASSLLTSSEKRDLCREKCQELGILLEKKSPELEIAKVLYES